MGRSLPIRFAVSLAVCGLVGVGLALSAGGSAQSVRRATVVTTSSGTVEGRFRGTSTEGVVLATPERRQVIPWSAVAELSFAGDPAEGTTGSVDGVSVGALTLSLSPLDPEARHEPTRQASAPVPSTAESEPAL